MFMDKNKINPLLSIVVPIYNVAKYLPYCLNSIINQTFQDFELILIDDGSTDESGEICDEYARNNKKIMVVHQQNQGLSGARNAGIRLAKGKYLAFVDSDDYIHPQMYESMVALLEKENLSLCSCGFVRTSENRELSTDMQQIENSKIEIWNCDEAIRNIGKMNLVVWNKVYRKDIVEGLLFEKNAFSEDIGYNSFALQRVKTSICHISYPFYYYRVNRFGSSGTQYITESRFKAYKALNGFLNYVEQNYSKEALNSVAYLAAGYYITNYVEERSLLNSSQVGKQIVGFFKEALCKMPLRNCTINYLFFYISPCMYYSLKKLLRK